jgi:LysM repeat protein
MILLLLLVVISLLLIAQMALGPGVAFSAPPASGPVAHVVQAGDNLFRISLRYGTTVKAIMAANHLTSTIIHVGQRLVIPGSEHAKAFLLQEAFQPGEDTLIITHCQDGGHDPLAHSAARWVNSSTSGFSRMVN